MNVQPLDNYELIIGFSNHEYRQYDVKPLLEKDMCEPLKNRAFFKTVKLNKAATL